MKLCSSERVYYLSSVKSWCNSFGIFPLHREKFLFPVIRLSTFLWDYHEHPVKMQPFLIHFL